MKKPRKDRRTATPQVAPLLAVLVLQIANGQALAVTLRSEGLSPAAGA